MESEELTRRVACLRGGDVQYSLEDAIISLQDLKELVEELEYEGVTHVVMGSGNYRGAQWQKLSTDFSIEQDEEDE